PRHRCSPAEQRECSRRPQLFKCGLVVWWRTPSLLHRLECEVVPGRGYPPLPGARILSTRLAISRQLFDAWCHARLGESDTFRPRGGRCGRLAPRLEGDEQPNT